MCNPHVGHLIPNWSLNSISIASGCSVASVPSKLGNWPSFARQVAWIFLKKWFQMNPFSLAESEIDKSQVGHAKFIRRQLMRRLFKVLRDAESKGNAEEVAAAFERWISAFAGPLVVSKTETFLEHAQRLADRGQTDASLDIIYDRIDEMLLAGEFDQVDRLLVDTSPNTLSVDLLLGVLTVTLPARKRLANRAAFFALVEQTLRERGALKESLLVGLE